METFNLTYADFVTKVKKSTVTATWISPELLKLLPKQHVDINKETSVEVKSSVASVRLFQTTVDIIFDPNEVQYSLDSYVTKINSHLNWLSYNKAIIDEIIARDLLELKNSSWLDVDEHPLTKEFLISSIKLISINFFDDMSCELNFDDKDIFAGHTIVVSVTKDKQVTDAEIQG